MSLSINEHLVIQFGDMVNFRAQQMASRLKGRVEEQPVRGNEFTYERFDQVEAIEVTTRHADTVAQQGDHDRRGTAMRHFSTTLFLDRFDDLQVLVDPTRTYVEAVAKSMMRQYDRRALEAALAPVRTGRRLDTTVSPVDDGVQTVAAAATGLTYDKLVEIHENFLNAEVGLDMDEELYLAITAKQHADLMKEGEMINRDFSNFGNNDMGQQTVIDRGRITKAAGINLLVFGVGANVPNPLIKATGNVRHCIAFAKSGIRMGINQDITIDIDNRPDKNNLRQVQAHMFLDGLRTEGVKVQQVDCQES